ncbi:MAG: response regulator [Chloroflexi bacterium]|nr:response regulator [Chloroflexota bacterium]
MEKLKTWKLLLIDDDEDDYIITREMLADAKGARSELTWAPNFEEGRQKLLSNNNYDAVLIDYDLGLHTGIEIIREASTSGYSTPLILLTGRGNYEIDVEAMEAGASVYLSKSEVTALLLERTIRYAIERRRTEEALRASEERFRTLASVLPLAVYTIDANGLITYYNQHAVALWGREPKLNDPAFRYLGAYRLHRIDGSLMPVDETPIFSALHHGESFRDLKVIIERPDSTRSLVAYNVDPIRNRGDQIVGVIIVFRDLTEHIRLEEENRKLQAELEEKNRELEAAISRLREIDQS